MADNYERETDAHERGYLLGSARAADSAMMSLATALELYECSDPREQRTRRVQGQIVEAMRVMVHESVSQRFCAGAHRASAEAAALRDLLNAYLEPADIAAIGEVA